MESRFLSLPFKTQLAIERATVALVHARRTLAARQEVADRAHHRLTKAVVRAERLREKMDGVKYPPRPDRSRAA